MHTLLACGTEIHIFSTSKQLKPPDDAQPAWVAAWKQQVATRAVRRREHVRKLIRKEAQAQMGVSAEEAENKAAADLQTLLSRGALIVNNERVLHKGKPATKLSHLFPFLESMAAREKSVAQ
jgi:hypothetical protein